jgi:cytochrome c-type biogenesis protein CcmF
MFAWLFLTFGLMLGMIWAYEELGWGGYWGWDPVENAALLPWFTATAFLHSVMVQERRAMLRVWNVVLVILTFFLTIFGTFLTRSGIVQSVHAFGQDPTLTWLFSIFMVILLTFSFGLVIYRLPLLRARNDLDSWVSREAAFLANNWILLFCAFFIMFATMFPTLSELLRGERLTVAAPFYNKWMLPIGLVLLVLTGVAPLLAWRKSTLVNLRDSFLWPTVAAVAVGALFVSLGFRVWASGLCFALCAFVAGTIVQEFWRGANVRRSTTGTDFFTALVGIVGRNKRRYGGYIVHLGIVLIFFGFAGEGFKQESQVLMRPGEETTLGRYMLRYDRLSVNDDGQKQMTAAHMSVFRDGTQVGSLYPAKWAWHGHETEPPTTEVAIRRAIAEDLYLVLAAAEAGTQAVSLQIFVNPLVNWVWFGFCILALGTGIALLPERSYAFALASLPEATATTTTTILLALLLAAPLAAQTPLVPPVEKSELRKQLEADVMCTCGCHAPMADCPMGPTCHGLKEQNARLDRFLGEGMDRQQVRLAMVAEAGSQNVLAAPIDEGFNRLAWLFPYLMGIGGAVAAGIAVVRWSRRHDKAPAEVSAPADPSLDERLDDELRSLD